MRERLLDLLRCPTCVARLDLETFATRGDQIVDGALRCPVCRTVYPII
ncbi:MAG: Trm112 family protein, partial [Candidatus Rokuibacteriota bacterium]